MKLSLEKLAMTRECQRRQYCITNDRMMTSSDVQCLTVCVLKCQAEEEAVAADDAAEKEQLRRNRMCKDPTARTDFLPDKEREAEEEAVRAQLRKEYELRQKVCLLSGRHLHAQQQDSS